MPSRRESTVIVVDDDRSVRNALQRLLRAAGHHVECLASAAAYLEYPVAAGPACLVLDVRMPGMTGFELEATIRGTPRALPVVFITGHGEEEVRPPSCSSSRSTIAPSCPPSTGPWPGRERPARPAPACDARAPARNFGLGSSSAPVLATRNDTLRLR
jgi:CheY-like chemotaxis protein